MTNHRNDWKDADWAARCRAGDPEVLTRTAVLFIEYLCADVLAWPWRHARPSEDDVSDALQDLFAELLESPESLLGAFDPAQLTLEEYLARRVRQRAERLRRSAVRRHRHEAGMPVEPPETRWDVEAGVEERAGRLLPWLTQEQRDFLLSLLRRTFSDASGARSRAAVWQFVHRIHAQARRQDAEDARRARGKNS